jgi:hypothetical protein
MPRVAVKTGLAHALAFGILLFLSPLDAKNLRGMDNRILPAEDKAAMTTTTTAPEEDKGMITNAIVGAGAAWATGGSMTQGAVGGVIGGAMTGSPMGAAAGGYLGGSKEEIPVEDKAMTTEPEEDKGMITNALVGGAAAWATGGSVMQGAAGGVVGGAMKGSPMGAAAGGYLGGSA